MDADPNESSAVVTRRRALGLISGVGAAFAFRCGGSTTSPTAATDGGSDAGATGASDTGASDTSAAETSAAETSACTVTPEGEIGPYFADDSDPRFNRSNLLTNLDGSSAQTGMPLTLTIIVRDAKNGCVPYANAHVDIWHCNSAGIYSDQASESTSTQQWLRGYQVTDATGKVTFVTVIPGWYSGRTTHIHLRVRSIYSEASSTTDGTNTTQLFFDQALVDRLATSVAPYSAEGTNGTTNAGDRVYSEEENGANVLSLTGSDASGYAATVTIDVPIAAAVATTGMGGP